MRAIWLAVAVAGAGLVTACKDSQKPTENGDPNANFSANCDFLQCTFHDSSTDDGELVSWIWSFGVEGSNQRNPTYNYPSGGTYQVKLTVKDDEGASASITKTVDPKARAVTSLSCVDPDEQGGFIACTLKLQAEASITVKLNSSSCEAHGNSFRVIAPSETAILTTDGCYEQVGKTITLGGVFGAGSEINAEVVAPLLKNPPRLIVGGEYPVWHLTYEDGADTDFDDLDITLTAVATGH
jgi:PKD domain-containing protein